jgi:hypothetical protein
MPAKTSADSNIACPPASLECPDLSTSLYEPQPISNTRFDGLLEFLNFAVVTGEVIDRRRRAFESRLAELKKMCLRLEDLASATLTYETNPEMLAQDFDTIIWTLKGTLDGENPDLWHEWSARSQLIHETKRCLELNLRVLEVIQLKSNYNACKRVLSLLSEICEAESQFGPGSCESQLYLEQALSDDAMWAMVSELDVLTTCLNRRVKPSVIMVEAETKRVVKLGDAEFEIDQTARTIRRVNYHQDIGIVDFGAMRQNDRWIAAVALLDAHGEGIDFAKLFPSQSDVSLRKLVENLRAGFSVIDVSITSIPRRKSHWQATAIGIRGGERDG